LEWVVNKTVTEFKPGMLLVWFRSFLAHHPDRQFFGHMNDLVANAAHGELFYGRKTSSPYNRGAVESWSSDGNPVTLHFSPKGRAVNTQFSGSRGRTAGVSFKCLGYKVALYLLEDGKLLSFREVGVCWKFLILARQIGRKVSGLNLNPFRQDNCVLDDILQFTNISRKVIIQKDLQG